MGASRKELHRLIDTLPDKEIETAKRFLEYLATYDPVFYSLHTAPYDDEPTTEKEDLEAKSDWEEYLQGDSISSHTAKKEIFGE